jgi:hypothetical protein
VVDNFALRFARAIQSSLTVALFEVAAMAESSTPAKRLLVLLAARTAIDAAVAHAATEAKPIDAELVADAMNLPMSRDRVRDLHSLRMACMLTYRSSFPVPRHPHLQLPTGVVESFVGGSCLNKVPFRCICRALALHVGEATAAASTAEAAVAAPL